MLQGKKILLAVTGSIAAYKTAFFVRLLVKQGAEVKVIMTASAKDFITPLTLATLSKNPVFSDFFDRSTGVWESHVELGLWADAMVVAPASANTLAKMAQGLSDNLLLATYLSARCPVFFAPAMDLDMHLHPATEKNIEVLLSHGNHLIAAEDGELASGLQGVGRMAEPETLVAKLEEFWSEDNKPLAGKKVLITSGPTHEPIDAVRFIGNHSSGKMGTALAQKCVTAGADVIFITGPARYTPASGVHLIQVKSADEMFKATSEHFGDADIAIFAAAVGDYKPSTSVDNKLKRDEQTLSLELIPNKDIAAEMGQRKQSHQFTVGFALETDDESANAQKKLEKKNLDMIVLNSLNDKGAGFSHNTNKVSFFFPDNNQQDFELKSKDAVASDIVKVISKRLNG